MTDAKREQDTHYWAALDVDSPRGGCLTTFIRANSEEQAQEYAMVELGWRGARNQVFREADLEEIDGALDTDDFVDAAHD